MADGLRTQSVGEINFQHISQYVDNIITVSEDEIRAAIRKLALEAKLIVEPSGAVSFAGLLFHADQLPSTGNYVIVISGGNIAPELLAEIIRRRSGSIKTILSRLNICSKLLVCIRVGMLSLFGGRQ